MAVARVLAVFVSFVAGAEAQTRLGGHSIENPPNIYKLSHDWFLAGTAIPSGRGLVLSPGVPGRSGLLWSTTPLLTDDFEVALSFTSEAPATPTVTGAGFALWYVQENGTEAQSKVAMDFMHNEDALKANSWETGFRQEGFDLFAYRSKFNGLGVFFCDDPATKQATIGGLINNGNMPYTYGQGVPPSDGIKFNWHSGNEVKVKVRVQAKMAKIEVEGGGTMEIPGEFKSGGYLGFTVVGGVKGAVDPKERSDFVQIKTMDISNFASSQGEEVQDTAEEKKVDRSEDLLAKTSSFRDHRAESDAIKDLTNMVFKLVVESQPMRTQMVKAIESLGKRITVMESTFESLKTELDKKTGHKLGEEFANIKKELTSLSRTASSETEERHKRLDNLHTDIATVHATASSGGDLDKHIDKLAETNKRTLDNLNDEHQKMFGVSISAIAFIVVAGLALYNKFRCWEKKHVL